MSIATQTPGILLITVTGYNIPKGPQNYSLAVQGDFTGVLASPNNPSWNRTSNVSCSLPLPQITSGPLGLINQSSVAFTYTSSGGIIHMGHRRQNFGNARSAMVIITWQTNDYMWYCLCALIYVSIPWRNHEISTLYTCDD